MGKKATTTDRSPTSVSLGEKTKKAIGNLIDLRTTEIHKANMYLLKSQQITHMQQVKLGSLPTLKLGKCRGL